MFFFYCKLNYTFGGCRCQIFGACFSGKKAQLSPCFPFARFKCVICTVQTIRLHSPNGSFARSKPAVFRFPVLFLYPGRLPEIFCCPDFSVCMCRVFSAFAGACCQRGGCLSLLRGSTPWPARSILPFHWVGKVPPGVWAVRSKCVCPRCVVCIGSYPAVEVRASACAC